MGIVGPKTVDVARTIGQKFIVVNSIDRIFRVQQADTWGRTSERLNRAGEICRTAGLQLAYHNHLFEFASIQGTKRPYDILLESTDPSLVSMQMDLCWFIAAGQDPVTFFKRFPGRYSSVHVKDLKRLPRWTEPIRPTTLSSELESELADVGEGVIDWRTTLSQCWAAGIRHYYVEHDSSKAPLNSAGRSFAYLYGMDFNTTAP